MLRGQFVMPDTYLNWPLVRATITFCWKMTSTGTQIGWINRAIPGLLNVVVFWGTRENCENSIRGLCFLLNSNSKKCTSLQKFDYHRAFEYTHSGYHCFTSNNYTIIILSGPAKFLYFPEDLKNGGKKWCLVNPSELGISVK